MKNNLLKAIGINIIIVITESTIGFMSGSMALISDALHNLTDVVAGFYYFNNNSQYPTSIH